MARSRLSSLPSKPRRYATAINNAILTNPANETMRLEYHRRSGLKLFNGDDVIYQCDASHRLVKNCYFVFCLVNKNMTEFIEYLRNNGDVIQDCGELSPENTPITEP